MEIDGKWFGISKMNDMESKFHVGNVNIDINTHVKDIPGMKHRF